MGQNFKTVPIPPSILPLPSHRSQSGHFTGGGGGVESSASTESPSASRSETILHRLWLGMTGTKDWTPRGTIATPRKRPNNRRLAKNPDRIEDGMMTGCSRFGFHFGWSN